MLASSPVPGKANSETSRSDFTLSGRRLLRDVLAMGTIGENRLELLVIELQEERERLFRTLAIVLPTAVLLTVAGVALTVTLVMALSPVSRVLPGITVAVLLYFGGVVALYKMLRRRLFEWEQPPETVDHLRQDIAALTAHLE